MASVQILVKLTPKAARNAVKGWTSGAEGENILKCSVTAAPEKGKANKALVRLLADYWGMPKSAVSVVRGATERIKTIEIQGVSEIPPGPGRTGRH